MKTLLLLSVLALLPAESTQAQAPPSLKEIEPPDVYVHVDHVRQELELLRAWMGRPRDERPELGISGAEPREVFFQAITLFRKADRLAFEQTQRRARGAPRLPAGEIRPSHVYGRLLDATDAIREIVLNSGLESLDLERPDQVEIDAAAPSDVYDIASLLVSELAHLHAKLPDPTPPREAYFPGRKFPSDVYQRAGILEAQLSSLRQLSAKNPEWLER
jgi:hypothetical protein